MSVISVGVLPEVRNLLILYNDTLKLMMMRDLSGFVQVPFPLLRVDEYTPVDFLGQSVDLQSRIRVVHTLLALASEDELKADFDELQPEQLCFTFDSVVAARDMFFKSNKDLTNLVDIVYDIRFGNKTDLFDKHVELITDTAMGGFDLVYYFADLSEIDYKEEFERVKENRIYCFGMLESIREKVKEGD